MRPLTAPHLLTLALLSPGCTTAVHGPCFDHAACASGLCRDGVCAPEALRADPGDGSMPRDEPDSSSAEDVGTADARANADGDPPDEADADPSPDATPVPCLERDRPTVSCGLSSVAQATCQGGEWVTDGCLRVPSAPCGATCDGCDGQPPDGVVDRRLAYELHPAAAVMPEGDPFAWVVETCTGCMGEVGMPDRQIRREFDLVEVETETWLGYVDGARDLSPDRTTRYRGATFETEWSGGGRPVESGRITRRPDGRMASIESSVDEVVIGQEHWLYDPSGLYLGREWRDGDGQVTERLQITRDAEGVARGARLERFPDGGEALWTYEFGCWARGEGGYELAPTLDVGGCVHLPATFGLTACVDRECPPELTLAALAQPADGVWIGEVLPLGSGLIEPGVRYSFYYRVGAEREDGAFRWAASGAPLAPEFWADGEPSADGDCAALVRGFSSRWGLVAEPCDRPPEAVLCAAP